MLKHLFISLNYKEELHFQDQYSEFITQTALQVRRLSSRAALSRGRAISRFLSELQGSFGCDSGRPALSTSQSTVLHYNLS